MASYHLSVKTVKRSTGRSAVAAAAYRAGERLACEREGRVHDYTRKQGVADCFIVSPADTPGWARDRDALWNAVETRETRRNSVTAREWELALPSELDDVARAELARDFAQALVARYGVACDVAVHAPHRDGDQRNHHAHILTTTREIGAEGLGAKTRILDAAKTGGAEIAEMRALWAGMQNRALERAELEARVDHRSLEAQREAALDHGDELAAMELDRDPEIKLGPSANAMERKAMRAAEIVGADYMPVTDRGAQNNQRRQQRDLLGELRARAERARDAYEAARAQEASRLSAAVDAAKALFADPAVADFAREFDAAWQDQEAARQHAIEEERERERRALEEAQARERLRLLEEEKARFIEEIAQGWEASRQVVDREAREEQQDGLIARVEHAAERYGVDHDDLVDPINVRANEIRDERIEQEKQREIEREQAHSRHSGPSHGL